MNTLLHISIWLSIGLLIMIIVVAACVANNERNHVKKLKEMKKESDKREGRTHV